MNKQTRIPLRSLGWEDYELIDSGNSRKLERFGEIMLDRFEPDALWKPTLKKDQWTKAYARYVLEPTNQSGYWEIKNDFTDEWMISLDSLRIALKLSQSRHIGIFPEQLNNWAWAADRSKSPGKKVRVLNLFAYTGVATLFCAEAGAEVTHVDASRSAIALGKKSQELSGLKDAPIRWIVDDVMKFVQREVRRGNKYEGIMLDPPLFGRGPKGEVWKLDQAIGELLGLLDQLFSKNNPFFLLTAYNHQYPDDFLAKLSSEKISHYSGPLDYGPLLQIEKSGGRELKQAEYVRFAEE